MGTSIENDRRPAWGRSIQSIALGLLFFSANVALADDRLQDNAALPQVDSRATAPLSEDIVRIIAEMGSVRDYERLRWLLDAIEQQVPPVRAELLKRLDDHVQQLVQAEVERRVASAVGSLALLSQGASDAGRSGADQAASSSRAAGAESSDTEAQTKRPVHLPSYEYDTVSQEIEALTLVSDPKEQRDQTSTVFRKIVNVEDPAKRMLLLQQLDNKKRAALQLTIEAKKHELKQRYEAQQAAAAEMGGSSPNVSR